ncbi:late competence development ComFB family protein [Proteinivorax tanatarense]|uniref:Late competence development ComFB family protein n=1 Tax=Proteinivorax tanatarense TaxID=1260629 RepID=A0AAU7VPC8_9FIRM
MEILNYNEILVKEKLNEMWKEQKLLCKCKKCRLDVMALALNQLPPKYVVSEKGELYLKANSFNLQASTDVTKAIVDAMGKVERKPNH